MFAPAGRLIRTALLAVLLTAAAATPAVSLRSAATRPAGAVQVAAAAPKAPSEGVAVIYKDSASNVYRVHNALFLRATGAGVKIAHVARWPSTTNRPVPDELWVCYHPQTAGCHHSWTLVTYHRYRNHGCPSGYCPGAFIAFKQAGHRPHNGAFACWQPANSTACSRTWPGDNNLLNKNGRLRYVHYVNPSAAPGLGSYATSPDQFKFRLGTVDDTVSAQRLCYLRQTC
ncbi:hypothetical protein [Streptomyces sp. AF1A]|uniref:hypothetical protein n=1 Tax=Streptomyces sp. AF1A TaxID=3394350 RepID=UPI0039BD080C